MKILLVNDYATLTGGAEMMMLALKKGLIARGYEVRLFSTSARKGETESIADYECFGTTSSFRTLLQSANPWAVRKMHQVIREWQPEIVHARVLLTQLSPLILPLLRDIPSIFHVAWYRPICPIGTKMLPNETSCEHQVGLPCLQQGCLPIHDWLPLMFQMKLWNEWRNVFDVVVSNSFWVEERLKAEGIDSNTVVWNGVPLKPSRPPLTSLPTVVYAGQLAPSKGVDVLLNAFARVKKQIPQAQLLIAGKGNEREYLLSLTNELGLDESVKFLGHLSRNQMEEHFSCAWVQVVPSRWAEPFGIVATEAMMRGTAVIASSSGGLGEIVLDRKTGFSVPPGEVEPLADRLMQVLNNRDLAEKMGKEGRNRAQMYFSETAFVERFTEIYKNLLQSKQGLEIAR
jgi:glycosyltransferase involved in cell wall biosynthesis